jgi:hypothetical protein
MGATRFVPLLAFAWPSAAHAQAIGAGVGASHLSGRFGGTERTTVESVYVSANAASDGWRLDLTLPYLRVAGAGTIDIGGIIVPIEGSGRAEGVGDLTIRVTRSLPDGLKLPVAVSLSGQVKLPTGASGVSTGQTDYAFDLEVSREVGSLSPSITVGYRVLGDLEFLPLKNGWSLSAGTGLTLGNVFVSASYDWSEAVTGGPDPQEVYALAAGPISQGWSWNVYASKGLSAGSPDRGVGVGISRGFGRKRGRAGPPGVPPRW